MANISVSVIESGDNYSVSPEIRQALTAKVAARDFTEVERAVLVDALMRLHADPKMDVLSEVARLVRRGVQSKGTTMPLSLSDYRQNILLAEASALGIDKDLASKIIAAAFEKAVKELQAEAEARPERVSMKSLLSEIAPGCSLEDMRSAVCGTVKAGKLSPEQVDRRAIIKAYGADEHPAASDKGAHAALAAVNRAIEQGVEAALMDWAAIDTPATATIRANPTVETIQAVVADIAQAEGGLDVGVFERLLAPAILEAENIVVLPENPIDRALEAEIAAIRQSPKPMRQLLSATMRVARDGSQVNVNRFTRLCRAITEQEAGPVVAIVPPDVLTAPVTPEAPQDDTRNILSPAYKPNHAPAPEYQPRDVAPTVTREELRPDENGRIAAGTELGNVRDFPGTFRTFTPPATPAEPSTRAVKVAEWDKGSIARKINLDARIAKKHDSLAQRRGTK